MRKARPIGCVVAAVVSAFAVAALMRSCSAAFGHQLLRTVARSPAGLGTTELVTDNSSFAGADAWIYVRDPYRGSRPMRLGGPFAFDSSVKLRRCVWSRDGSFLAVEVLVGESAGKHLVGNPTARYAAAYDFAKHAGITLAADAEPAPEGSGRITRLLASRGGIARALFDDPYVATGKEIPFSEMSAYPR